MSNIWVRAWRNTPQYDCGLCGRPTCTAFARAYFANDLELDACPVLKMPEFGNLRTSLESMREHEQALTPKPAPAITSKGISFLQPCKDDANKVTGEFRIYNGIPAGQNMRFGGFDPIVLCDLLDNFSEFFESVKCSRELGYARADHGEMNITILQDGRINLRQVPDTETAFELATLLERSLLGALICDCCGCDLLNVLTGCMGSREEHPVLGAGRTIMLEKSIAKKPLSRSLANKIMGDSASELVTVLDTAFGQLKEGRIRFLRGERGFLKHQLSESYHILFDILNSDSFTKSSTILLKAVAILRVIENAIAGLAELSFEIKTDSDEVKSIESLLRLDHLNDFEYIRENTRRPTIAANLARINRAIQLQNYWNSD